jgi:hypothetical protein
MDRRPALKGREVPMSEYAPSLEPWKAVESLLAIEDEDVLEQALAAASPVIAARAVSAAPNLERKTTLLWALEDRRRRDVLELLPPALVGALVQNLEEDNRYLLGDLSLEQFRALLSLCSPERKYYWITAALSFTDARANALPLLLTTPDLVEILLTRAEFEDHTRALADYPLEDSRLPAELFQDPAQTLIDLFGPENLLRQFPIADAGLAQLLQTVLDYDPDRYVDIVRQALRRTDYAENHPLEWGTLTEDPVLLESLESAPVAAADLPDLLASDDALPGAAAPPLALVPLSAAPLARLAGALPPAQRERVGEEMQYLYIRQAVAEGGSFLLSDLRRVARSVEAYLLLGVAAESGGDPGREAAVLAGRPLHKIAQSGARVVEGLRQVALRLQPLENVLSAEQRALVRSLVRPRLALEEDGTPRIDLLPAGTLPESASVPVAAGLLQEAATWAAVARALGLERVERAVRERGSVERVLESLALSAVLYTRIELGLAEPADARRFLHRYVAPGQTEPSPEARDGLGRIAEGWAGSRGLDARSVVSLLDRALDRLAGRPGE